MDRYITKEIQKNMNIFDVNFQEAPFKYSQSSTHSEIIDSSIPFTDFFSIK